MSGSKVVTGAPLSTAPAPPAAMNPTPRCARALRSAGDALLGRLTFEPGHGTHRLYEDLQLPSGPNGRHPANEGEVHPVLAVRSPASSLEENRGATIPSLECPGCEEPSAVFIGELQGPHVLEIHLAAGSPLGGNQVLLRDERQLQAGESHHLPWIPCLSKYDARRRGLNAFWDSILEDGDPMSECFLRRGSWGRCEAGFQQPSQEASCFVQRRFDEDVKVESRSGNAMEDRCDTPHHEVCQFTAAKGPEYLARPIEHRRRPSTWGSTPGPSP